MGPSSLSLPVAVFVSLIQFHCFTTETTLSIPLRDTTSNYKLYQIVYLWKEKRNR